MAAPVHFCARAGRICAPGPWSREPAPLPVAKSTRTETREIWRPGSRPPHFEPVRRRMSPRFATGPGETGAPHAINQPGPAGAAALDASGVRLEAAADAGFATSRTDPALCRARAPPGPTSGRGPRWKAGGCAQAWVMADQRAARRLLRRPETPPLAASRGGQAGCATRDRPGWRSGVSGFLALLAVSLACGSRGLRAEPAAFTGAPGPRWPGPPPWAAAWWPGWQRPLGSRNTPNAPGWPARGARPGPGPLAAMGVMTRPPRGHRPAGPGPAGSRSGPFGTPYLT